MEDNDSKNGVTLQNSGPAHGNLSNPFEERDITIGLLLFNDMEMSGPVFCVFYNLSLIHI